MQIASKRRPTDILSSEHRVIEQVIGCLGRIADDAERTGTLDTQSADMALDFIRNFADLCHHAKEEKHLFAMLEKKGFPRDVGPMAVMLGEHELGRTAVREMSSALDAAAARDPMAVMRFVRHARSYVDLLTQHVAKEDQVLFPMAEGMMTDADRNEVVMAFEHTEHHDLGPGTHERFLNIADELGQRFQVRRRDCGSAAPAGGCCHH